MRVLIAVNVVAAIALTLLNKHIIAAKVFTAPFLSLVHGCASMLFGQCERRRAWQIPWRACHPSQSSFRDSIVSCVRNRQVGSRRTCAWVCYIVSFLRRGSL